MSDHCIGGNVERSDTVRARSFEMSYVSVDTDTGNCGQNKHCAAQQGINHNQPQHGNPKQMTDLRRQALRVILSPAIDHA